MNTSQGLTGSENFVCLQGQHNKAQPVQILVGDENMKSLTSDKAFSRQNSVILQREKTKEISAMIATYLPAIQTERWQKILR